jgi:hypothetical protein
MRISYSYNFLLVNFIGFHQNWAVLAHKAYAQKKSNVDVPHIGRNFDTY